MVAGKFPGQSTLVMVVTALGTAAILAAAGLAPWLVKRRQRQIAAETLGLDVDFGRLRESPADLDVLRERVVSVGVLRTGQSGDHRQKDYGEGLTHSFVITREGDTVDLAATRDPARVVGDALWLAQQLQVPLLDGRTSQTRTLMPAELEGLDEDLVRLESEPESEDPLDRTRRAARSRQRT